MYNRKKSLSLVFYSIHFKTKRNHRSPISSARETKQKELPPMVLKNNIENWTDEEGKQRVDSCDQGEKKNKHYSCKNIYSITSS